MGKTRMFNAKLRGLNITRLMARDGDKCWWCGGPLDRALKDEYSKWYITFDHVVRQADGGEDKLANIKLAHQGCNNERHDLLRYLGKWSAHGGDPGPGAS
jgi:5-methylcytosine-specific restriction endonuclease McrA